VSALEVLEERGFVRQCTHPDEVHEALSSGVVTLYTGFDPTASSLHVGHLYQVMALTHLQLAGHRVIALVGGGTARIGDPTGRTELRRMLTDDELAVNGAAFRRQLSSFLTLDGTKGVLVDNADWLLKLELVPFLREIGSRFSVNKMLAAEAYKLRMEHGLSFIELNYQILQAYDFLALYRDYGCRLQVGGDDQWGNIVAGVDLVRRVESAAVWGLTTPLLTTASGAKMGKTAKGAVWLDPELLAPFDYWQSWYNVDDADVGKLLRVYTLLPLAEITRLETLRGAELRDAKRILATEATALAHGREAATRSATAANAMTGSVASEQLPTFGLDEPVRLAIVLVRAGLAKSNGEARRLVAGGGVRIDGEKAADAEQMLDPAGLGDGVVVRVGKARAVRLVSIATKG
jgi:tyrosyl-tRNA synthetase